MSEVVVPTWLDKAFFERALRRYEHDPTVEVQNFEVKPACKPGENFVSAIFRADVSYLSKKYRTDNKRIKLIVKSQPEEDGYKKDFVKDSPAFKNESRMYGKVLPEMERVLEHAGDPTKFGPKLVYESLTAEQVPVIVIEDLVPHGYQIFDGLGITNFDTLNNIAKKLAKFHAVSLYLNENVRHVISMTSL